MNKQVRQLLEDYVRMLPEQGYRPYLDIGHRVRLVKDGGPFCPLTAVSHAFSNEPVDVFQWDSCKLPLKRFLYRSRSLIASAADQEGSIEIRALLLQCLGLTEAQT